MTDPFFNSGGFNKVPVTPTFPEDVPSFRDFFPAQPLKPSPSESPDDFTK